MISVPMYDFCLLDFKVVYKPRYLTKTKETIVSFPIIVLIQAMLKTYNIGK